MDMMQLCWSDNMGPRDIIPGLMIRLGRDQDAYDFLLWYATTGSESTYDWGDAGPTFLNVKGANAFESIESRWTGQFIDLSHSVCVALIKMRILLDLQAIQNASRALNGTVPREIIELIRGELIGGIVESAATILRDDMDDMACRIQDIKHQIKDLYVGIKNYNTHFFHSMLEHPEDAIENRPNSYSPRSVEEAQLTIGHVYAACVETPGAVEVLESISRVVG
jgi:hypothetical protein